MKTPTKYMQRNRKNPLSVTCKELLKIGQKSDKQRKIKCRNYINRKFKEGKNAMSKNLRWVNSAV